MKKMLSKILGKAPPEPKPGAGWDLAALAGMIERFPVGARVLYSPEFKPELRLETVLLGCSVNKTLVYSQSELDFRRGHVGPELWLGHGSSAAPVGEVRSFSYLIPHLVRTEIDYAAGFEPGAASTFTESSVNDFERNSLVTLIAYSPYGKVPHLDTLVRSTAILTAGFYANHKVVLLEPLPRSLRFHDKRAHQRVATRIPIALRASGDAEEHSALIQDFSERFLRIGWDGEGPPLDRLPPGERVAVALDLPDQRRRFLLQGTVFRRTRGSAVVELTGLHHNGRFAPLQLVDQLDLKATLLHHPETQRLLGDHSTGG